MRSHHDDPKTRRRKLAGDYQTPPALVEAVLDHLATTVAASRRFLEPTCGRGGFLAGLASRVGVGAEIVGIELDTDHAREARAVAAEAPGGTAMRVVSADLARVDLGSIAWSNAGPMLVVGNLPWVTNAELGAGGAAVPVPKANLRGWRGIDAMTGDSNFDIAEAFLAQIIRQLAPARPTVALLVKLATARSLFRWLERDELPVTSIRAHRIDARRHFGVCVEAVLLVVEVGPGTQATTMPIHDSLDPGSPAIGLTRAGSQLVADPEIYRRVGATNRTTSIVWRQGIKHDAAGVMELIEEDGTLRNKRGEVVDVEPEFRFPLFKSGDLGSSDRDRPRRWLIVPQTRPGEPIADLEQRAPRLWAYLQRNAGDFDRRRSSIYRDRARFAIFGVGDYSFTPYKVAVSGLHRTARFRLVEPVGGRPVVFDDTCYLLPFASRAEAAEAAERLNGPEAQRFIRSVWFPGSKRPITKAILSRINLDALAVPLSVPAHP